MDICFICVTHSIHSHPPTCFGIKSKQNKVANILEDQIGVRTLSCRVSLSLMFFLFCFYVARASTWLLMWSIKALVFGALPRNAFGRRSQKIHFMMWGLWWYQLHQSELKMVQLPPDSSAAYPSVFTGEVFKLTLIQPDPHQKPKRSWSAAEGGKRSCEDQISPVKIIILK